ncbi:TPA: hypothetical protein U0993_001333, partial [Streptococcus suis]|nr:hypothetical protein [Streptococcus suis]HEM3312619.1 hypothetical protein [Streptococcus suis]
EEIKLLQEKFSLYLDEYEGLVSRIERFVKILNTDIDLKFQENVSLE